MLQNHATLKNRHIRFIKKICQTELVYSLKSKEGYATSSSIHNEDEDQEPITLICFWAEKARAKSCKAAGWQNYDLVEIPLAQFLENWCVGMYHDNLLVGTAFDKNMFGYEAEPLDLIVGIIEELKSLNKNLSFKKFEGINDLEEQVRRIVDYC